MWTALAGYPSLAGQRFTIVNSKERRMNWKQLLDFTIRHLLRLAASMSILIVALIFLFLLKEALPFVREPGLGALFDIRWEPVSFVKERFGLWPLLLGSLQVTFFAILISVPFGVVSATYIAEIATPMEREFFKPFIELLAGIPSVVLGFFGMVVLAPLVKKIFHLSSGLTGLTGALL
ncbi:hypothetical protein JW933_04605, partial [candidate division FCPU426 bacterium]|nr:hypothetical protein [candidate division FCPU426 bacterium]